MIEPISPWREQYAKLLGEDGLIFMIGEQTLCSLAVDCRYQELIAQVILPERFAKEQTRFWVKCDSGEVC